MASPPANANGHRRRPTAQRDRMRKQIAARKDPCHICGGPIDYDLPYLDPGAFVVDHVIPIARGGPNVIANAAAAHRACNRAKGDRLMGELRGKVKQPAKPVQSSPIW